MAFRLAIAGNALLLVRVFHDIRFTVLASWILGNRRGLGVASDSGCQSLQLPQLRFPLVRLLGDFG
jgi:hypothetical protein